MLRRRIPLSERELSRASGNRVIVRLSSQHFIEIKDTETGEVLICEAADWTDEQRLLFIAQLLRLTGVSAKPERDGGRPQ